MKLTSKLVALLSILALALGATLAQAHAWPTKPIRITNPFPAGGGTDAFARPLAAKLTQALGQIVYIENQGSAGPMMQDFIAGQIDLVFDGMGTSASQIKGGRIRALAVATPKRLPGFPDIPSMDEAGVPGMVVNTWYALWAVKSTPKEIVDRMYKEMAKVLEQKDIRDIWAAAASDPGGMPPEQFGAYVHSEIARWAKVVKAPA